MHVGADLIFLRDGQADALGQDKEARRRQGMADLLASISQAAGASVEAKLERVMALIEFPVGGSRAFQVLVLRVLEVSVAGVRDHGEDSQGGAGDAETAEKFIQVLKDYWDTPTPTVALAKARPPSPAPALMR